MIKEIGSAKLVEKSLSIVWSVHRPLFIRLLIATSALEDMQSLLTTRALAAHKSYIIA